MAIADISKSLVHIQEKFVKRGPYSAQISIPATAGNVTGITVTGVKKHDFIIVQPTSAVADPATSPQYITGAFVTADNTITVTFAGTGTAVANHPHTVTVFARPFA